ncbi:MAG: hypothetical protein AB8G05_17015 [Oligoflexales bacterium]
MSNFAVNLGKSTAQVKWFVVLILLFSPALASADLKDLEARKACDRLYLRLNYGTPAPATFIDTCGGTAAAPKTFATEDEAKTHYLAQAKIAAEEPYFLKTVYSIASRWTTEDGKYLQGNANDVALTIVGAAKDNINLRRVMYDDLIYTCTGVVPAYSRDNLEHHDACAALPPSQWQAILTGVKQTDFGVEPTLVSGLTTLRGHCQVFANAGTNRAYIRFTLLHFLGEDIEGWQDLQVDDSCVGEDVPRAPGDETETYNKKCKACHAGMDCMRSAYAYIDWVDNEDASFCSLTPGVVAGKYSGNPGDDLARQLALPTVDDSWELRWNQNDNAKAGWRDENMQKYQEGMKVKGKGPASLNRLFANTDQFHLNAARQILSYVCNVELGAPDLDLHRSKEIKEVVPDPAADVSVKDLAARSILTCLEDK